MNYLYLLINGLTIVVPLLFSFHPKINFYKNWKYFFGANGLVALLFIFWDFQFTKQGVWGFNSDYLLGLYCLNLPIEEILFFICIPFSCVFTYHCLIKFYNLKWNSTIEIWFVAIFTLFLLVMGFHYWQLKYTSITFLSLAISLITLKFILKIEWLGKLLSIYPIILIPFFLVNGVLTGSCIQHPIVWYNNIENLNYRLGTIPVEDVFYGFELILLNLFFYELFKTKFNKTK